MEYEKPTIKETELEMSCPSVSPWANGMERQNSATRCSGVQVQLLHKVKMVSTFLFPSVLAVFHVPVPLTQHLSFPFNPCIVLRIQEDEVHWLTRPLPFSCNSANRSCKERGQGVYTPVPPTLHPYWGIHFGTICSPQKT